MRSMVLITLVCLSCTNPTPPNVDPDADADDMRAAVDLRKPAADLSSDLASDLAGTPPTDLTRIAVPAGLNQYCDAMTPCPSSLVCGTKGEARNQCVLSCPTKGPGEANGCPSGTFCYVYDKDEGHYCTRTCIIDADCQSANPALRCRDRASSDPWGLRLCVLG